jgi:signal transduction histidine kinase
MSELVRPRRVKVSRSRASRVYDLDMEVMTTHMEELERELAEARAHAAALENELAATRESAEQLERFAAMAAHELLRPLIMTEAFAQGIAERGGHGLDLDTRQDIDTLVRVSSKMRLLVETLLMEARPGGEPLQRQAVDMATVLKDCVDMLGSDIHARDARVEIQDMPVVAGDPALLTGVFGNLLANALQYGPRNGAEIHVSAERSEAGWTFSVESTGPAIPEGDRERIFEPWERATGERRARGVGLGLALVRQVVERHGGSVGVTSPAPAANRFFFTLPPG